MVRVRNNTIEIMTRSVKALTVRVELPRSLIMKKRAEPRLARIVTMNSMTSRRISIIAIV